MRISLNNGNGAKCDLCPKILNPFDIYRITGYSTIPGKHYPKVSSDITTKKLQTFHLCEDCYNRLIMKIETKNI